MKDRLKRLRVIAFTLAAIVAAYGVLGGLVAPPIAKRLIGTKLGERLGRVVTVDHVSINPYTLDVKLERLRVFEPDGKTPFASFDALDVNASAASLYRLAPVIERLTLTGLAVHVIRDHGSHYNVSDILQRLAPAAGKDGRKARPARFSVGNIRVVNAAIDFDDLPQGAKHRVSEVQLTIPFISSLPTHREDQVQPWFSAKIDGTSVKVAGEALPFENTIRTHFDLDIRALDLPRYMAYLPEGLPVNVDSGKLDATVSLRFTQAAGKEPTLDVAGSAALNDVSLSTRDGPLGHFTRLEADISSLDPIDGVAKVAALRLTGAGAMQDQWKIPAAEARDIDADLEKHALRVASLTTTGGQLTVRRNHEGSIDLPRIPPSEHPTKWDVALAKLALGGYRIAVIDASVKPAVTHRVVLESLDADNLSTEGGFKGSATAKVRPDKGGTLDASSTFTLDPLVVETVLDARSIDLVPLRAYVARFSTVALKSGALSARGTFSLRRQGDAIRVSYAGSADIDRFATLDTINKEELLDWESLKASGIKLDYAPDAPLELAMTEVVLDKAYSRIVVTPEGKLNVQQLLRAAAPARPKAAPPHAAARPGNIRVDGITFVDSRLNFTDHYIKPNYTADIRELQGSVTHLSSDPASRAAVGFKGRWNAASPVVIVGTVNPLGGDLFLDIGAKAQDIELTRLTAYSQRYAGYGITDGRLSLDVKYHIEGGKLQGRNKLAIDHLTFGEKVESPDATTLPVLFAVKLLTDAKGRIDIELPISGSLEDPKFTFSALIGQMFGNLFKTAASSPFSLIAAAAGGGRKGAGEDLAFVEFDPGHAELSAGAQKKLETLVKVLQDRPGLKLEIAARIDPAGDGEALRAAALQRELAAAPKDLSKQARERLTQEAVEFAEQAMVALSAKRAEQVKAYLTARGRLPQEQVLVASGAAPAKGQEGTKVRLSRVDFALR